MSSSPSSQPITLSSLTTLSPTQLHPLLLQSPTTTAIIDVRDTDHIGGHIRTSQWIPISQLDARLPELIRVNADKERVVFHCMLSQQRGPRAALAYAREKVRKGGLEGQEVYVLVGGFEAWQREFGEDKRVTEGYVRELWE